MKVKLYRNHLKKRLNNLNNLNKSFDPSNMGLENIASNDGSVTQNLNQLGG